MPSRVDVAIGHGHVERAPGDGEQAHHTALRVALLAFLSDPEARLSAHQIGHLLAGPARQAVYHPLVSVFAIDWLRPVRAASTGHLFHREFSQGEISIHCSSQHGEYYLICKPARPEQRLRPMLLTLATADQRLFRVHFDLPAEDGRMVVFVDARQDEGRGVIGALSDPTTVGFFTEARKARVAT
jgi:hypothetical protein